MQFGVTRLRPRPLVPHDVLRSRKALGISGFALSVVGGVVLSAGLMTTPTLAKHGGGKTTTTTTTGTAATTLISSPSRGGGGGGEGGNNLAALSTVLAPQPTGSQIVNPQAAIRLGKALFWDAQAGGDGQQACASCHFRAGEDIRVTNTVNPGPDGIYASEGVTGPGQTIETQSGGHPLFNVKNDDRIASQGVVARTFMDIDPRSDHPADICSDAGGPDRQVTGRKAPSVIGAVYNRDNFWDGRANHNFNGFNPFGSTANNQDGALVNMTNSSLASQADGPPNNPVEMSCNGRHFNGPDHSLAAKMLARKPLQFQQVSPKDSVLGSLADTTTGTGLTLTYSDLIAQAFNVSDKPTQLSQFSSFWGQAVQAYEATLIPDQTPMDKYLLGNRSALTANQVNGMNIFQGKGQCTECHAGAEMTDASVSFYAKNGPLNRDGGDQGFHNDGVRPTSEDLGRGNNNGPAGVSWSVSGSLFDKGAFKTPGLRDVGLKRSYMHNGGLATLTDVVNFYARGGDFANPEKSHDMKPLSLSASDISALVDFMQNGLTDCRVANDAAPFDHPALPVNNGTSLPATGGSVAACS
jgi:cytochrome c peroxidase